MIEEALTYNDVLLVPQYSDIKSRNEVSTSAMLGDVELKIPVIASPMDTISESDMAAAMWMEGGLAIVHRYNTIDEQRLHCDKASILGATVGAAIGTSGDYLDRATALYAAGVRILCVDVAHGHHILMKEALSELRKSFGDDVHIMAGNIATLEGYNDLVDWGADSVRCNIGGGSICSTRVQTGHGVPGLHTIIDCARSDRNVPIIADGGIRNSGDIVKALAAGANCIMAGSLFAGTDESPGEVFLFQGRSYKSYRGMGSLGAMARGSADRYFQDEINESIKLVPEGIEGRIPYKGQVSNVLFQLTGGLRSGMGYTGSKNLTLLKKNAKFVRLTNSGINESHVHGVQVTKEAPNYRSN